MSNNNQHKCIKCHCILMVFCIDINYKVNTSKLQVIPGQGESSFLLIFNEKLSKLINGLVCYSCSFKYFSN